MSGHSHAKTIAHQKNITDQKRGQVFSKMARLIAIAVKEGGVNLDTNYKLKVAMERARSVNMPTENIERAIKQASGGEEGKSLNEFSFDAYGPGGIALVIEGITDNRNRILGELKQLLTQHNGKLAQEGSVRWMFEKKGVIIISLGEQPEDQKNKETLEMKAIEAGAQDLSWQPDESLEIYSSAEQMQSVKVALEKNGVIVSSAAIDWVAKEEVSVSEKDKETAENLFTALDESNDVQDVYSNLKS